MRTYIATSDLDYIVLIADDTEAAYRAVLDHANELIESSARLGMSVFATGQNVSMCAFARNADDYRVGSADEATDVVTISVRGRAWLLKSLAPFAAFSRLISRSGRCM